MKTYLLSILALVFFVMLFSNGGQNEEFRKNPAVFVVLFSGILYYIIRIIIVLFNNYRSV
jgi:hypothetical protein